MQRPNSRSTRLALAAFAALMAAPIVSAHAQQKLVKHTASAVVASLGKVVSLSPLTFVSRAQTGDGYVTGTLVTTHNGPFELQAKLATASNDTISGKAPSGVYTRLSTTTWVTVATGAGGKNKASTVNYFVNWGKNTPKNKQNATDLPLAYRVYP